MAKIDELLKELCHDGVELVKFTDYANVQYGFAFDAKKFTEDPVYLPLIRIRDIVSGTASTYYSGKYSPEYIVEPGDILVGMDGNFNLGVWKDSAGLLNQRVCKLFSKDESILLNGFIKYYMKPIFNKIEQQTSAGSVKHLSAKTINGIKIHLPPLPIQQHIVEVLDTFTDAISNLEEELVLREKQFEYYREQLLAFDDEDIDKAELSSISDIKGRIGFRGYTRNDIVDKGAGAISLSPSNIVDGMLHFENSTYISWEKYEESPEIKASEGQIVLTKTGSTVGKVALIKYLPEPCTINPQLVLITCTTFNSAYLNYVLQSFSMQSEIKRLAGIGAVPNISQKLLGKIIVPIPSSERQQEIVEILDTFEAMIANIKEEIALRTKQYEYYREKLLSFGK